MITTLERPRAPRPGRPPLDQLCAHARLPSDGQPAVLNHEQTSEEASNVEPATRTIKQEQSSLQGAGTTKEAGKSRRDSVVNVHREGTLRPHSEARMLGKKRFRGQKSSDISRH